MLDGAYGVDRGRCCLQSGHGVSDARNVCWVGKIVRSWWRAVSGPKRWRCSKRRIAYARGVAACSFEMAVPVANRRMQ